MHDDKGPGCQLEGQAEGESIRILPGPPVSGLNHVCIYSILLLVMKGGAQRSP